MDSIEQKKVHNVHVKRVVQKLAHSVKAFCVTRILEQVMANLLNDEQKLFRVHGDGAGPVANLTGRARQYRRPDYTGTGEAGCEMYGTRRGRGMFRKIIYGTRRGGLANPTGRAPRGIKISCPAHLCSKWRHL
jgi:hypothetical protein